MWGRRNANQSINNTLKAATNEQAKQRTQAEADRQAAVRTDTRPQIPAPFGDDPWLPQMDTLNEVLGDSDALIPPARDIEGFAVQVRMRRVQGMHLLTSDGANEGDTEETRKPAPEQPLLSRLDEIQLAELIERHIDYVVETQDNGVRSVHLNPAFVKHFMKRTDDALPTIAAISTLPLVMPNGKLLAKRGLDRERGVVFQIPADILAAMPTREECTNSAVADAMRFLIEEWLIDVAADYTGKCTLIAAALTIIQRSLFGERPAIFVTAGRRGGGKTTTLVMLMMAATGTRPSAAAWSPNEEERRKAILAYLLEANPAIIWDNIPRGTQISCPHIEAACTTALYTDRRLGVSENITVSASTINLFTGNNIGPRGDLASRSLQVRLEVDRHDPENRSFKHSDPIGWTDTNRAKILRALHTVMLGNPVLKPGSNAEPKTRFKMWWRIVASAIENAAQLHAEDVEDRVKYLVSDAPVCSPTAIDFCKLFLSQEVDDEESSSLADVLDAMVKWKDAAKFKASDITKELNNRSEYQGNEGTELAVVLREFLFPKLPPTQDVSAKAVGKALKRQVGAPVQRGNQTLILKEWRDPNDGPNGALHYFVEVKG
jgi:hypothetical protein